MYHYLFNQLFLKLRLEKEKSELMNQVEKFASDLSKQEMLNVSLFSVYPYIEAWLLFDRFASRYRKPWKEKLKPWSSRTLA